MVKPANLMTSKAESESSDFCTSKCYKEFSFFLGAAHVFEKLTSAQLWKASGVSRTVHKNVATFPVERPMSLLEVAWSDQCLRKILDQSGSRF